MGDNSQIIVDTDAGLKDAEELAVVVREWLVTEEIIDADPGDSVREHIGGHRLGPNYPSVIEPNSDRAQISWENGVSAARRVDCIGGRLEFLIGRRVFDAGGNGIELHCESCEEILVNEQVFDAHPRGYMDAVGRWFDGDDRVSFPCPSCGKDRLLTEWRGPFPWAFGYLGFQFWNWPPLSREFVQRLTQKLGHCTVLVYQRI